MWSNLWALRLASLVALGPRLDLVENPIAGEAALCSDSAGTNAQSSGA
jgi:hypothetical protein